MEASAEALADPTAPETAESVGLININIYDSYLQLLAGGPLGH